MNAAIGKYLLQAIACFSAMAMTFTVIHVSEENSNEKEEQSIWMQFPYSLSSVLGSLSAALWTELAGRKNTLLVSNTLMIFGLLSRLDLIIIFGLGAFSTSIPLFLSEAAPPGTSRTFINLLYLFGAAAHLLEQAIEIHFDKVSDFWPQIFLSLHLIFLILYEGPNSFQLQTTHWKKNTKGYFKALKLNCQVRLSLLGGVLVHAVSQLLGQPFIIYQNQKVLQVGVISRVVEFSTMILILVTGFFLESVIIDKKGKKFMVLLGLGLIGLTLGAEGIIAHFGRGRHIIKWAGFVFYFFVYEPSMGATPWIIVSESLPSRYRGLASGIASGSRNLCRWIATFLPTKVEGSPPIYLLYAAITAFSFGLAYFIVQESSQNLMDKAEILQIKRKRNERRSFWVGQKKIRVREPIEVWDGGPKALVQLFFKKFGKNFFEINHVSLG